MEEFAFDELDNDDNDEHNGTKDNSTTKIKRKDIIINTKVGRYDSDRQHQFDFTYDTTIQGVKRSIRRMKCYYIDVLQIHDPEFVQPNIQVLIDETIPALLHCRDELHIVKAIGLTGYPLEIQYHILNQVSNSYFGDSDKIVFDQCLTYCHFNLHSQALFTKPIHDMDEITFEMRRGVQKVKEENQNDTIKSTTSFAKYCKQQKIPLMAAAPLSMGLLTHNPPPKWHPALISLQNACKDASAIAEKHDVDLPTLALIFALVNGDISCTLLGMADKKQVGVVLKVIQRVGDAVYFIDDENDIDKKDHDDSGGIHVNKLSKRLQSKIQSTLQQILTKDEMTVLKILMNDTNGPFSKVWANGEYEWDGVLEAEKFWSEVNEN